MLVFDSEAEIEGREEKDSKHSLVQRRKERRE
jgi:hypothetical protein